MSSRLGPVAAWLGAAGTAVTAFVAYSRYVGEQLPSQPATVTPSIRRSYCTEVSENEYSRVPKLPPNPKQDVRPGYPETALRYSIEGTVRVRFEITSEGLPHDVRVDSRVNTAILDDAVTQAVSQRRWRPDWPHAIGGYCEEWTFRLHRK